MSDHYSVPLTELIREFNLKVEYAATDIDRIRVTVADLSRPGLQLAGYFDHFEPMRLMVMGNVEISYLAKLTPAERYIAFDRLFSYKIPALVIARDTQPDPQCMAMAQKHNITVLRSKEATSAIISMVISYISSALAPRITRHGVLIEVYGEGILILGESGVGKSETAIELLKRGHRLIADDAVEIKKISGKSLIGTAPDLIRDYVELRGIGIVNVRRMYGIGAVKNTEKINMVIARQKNIALIAHDAKKELMVQFCIAYCGILSRHNLVATGTTGKTVSEATGLEITRFLGGSQGGSQQIASRIGCDEIDLLLLFRDPLTPKPSEPDENALLRLCDVHNIPVATNIATAEVLIHGLERGDLDWREIVKSNH